MYRVLVPSRFISSFKNNRKPWTYKWSDKRCKVSENYLNETNKFVMSNGQIWWNGNPQTDTQLMSYIIWNVKCVLKKKKILGKQVGIN